MDFKHYTKGCSNNTLSQKDVAAIFDCVCKQKGYIEMLPNREHIIEFELLEADIAANLFVQEMRLVTFQDIYNCVVVAILKHKTTHVEYFYLKETDIRELPRDIGLINCNRRGC